MSDSKDSLLMLSPKEMAAYAESASLYKVSKKTPITLISAFTAGIFISIGFVFYILIISSPDAAPVSGMTKFLGGATFSLGLMLVVVCGADLFTSTVLTILPKLTNKISWLSMFKNWVLVYLGNFVGALFFVALIWFSGQYLTMNGQWGLSVLNTANHKLEHSFLEAVCLGIFANLMVCLAVWLSYAGKTLIDKTLVMILPIDMFVGNGFEHSIANMFMIPLGIVIKENATPEFWEQTGTSASHYMDLNIESFLIDNLVPVTIGNILGGLMVAIVYWYIYLKRKN